MKTRTKGLFLAAIHLAFLLSLGGKLLLDRATRPRFWLLAAPVDPNLPIRGRYVDLSVSIPVPGKELVLDLWSRDQVLEYLRTRKLQPADTSQKGHRVFGPSYPWDPTAPIPQIRIVCKGSEAWGHLENAPEGTPGLIRRNSGRSAIRRSVGIDLTEENRLVLFPEPPQNLAEANLDQWLDQLPPGLVSLGDSLAFFILEHVPDPSRRAAGEELWVEVTLPKKGPLRPIRLAVKREGKFTVLDL